ATIELIEKGGGVVVGWAVLSELKDLHGRDKSKGYDIITLMKY
ncbi:adenine phosphoribosyltransferase, partial [Enterococcus faecium]|nr:adenine phosphoribosyltransferase [Enterococcus faecium]